MDKKKLKEKLHQIIDNLEDEKALQKLHEAAVEYEKAGNRDIVDELKPEQRKRLEEPIKQADEGKTTPDEEAMKRIAAWAFKLD
jgi:predicted transcriptional regulator